MPRKPTAFRLDERLLERVDHAVAADRAPNRTAAVEAALREWLASGAVVADAQPRDVSARAVEAPKGERLEIAARVPEMRPAASWLDRAHAPTCKCAVCKPPR